SAMMRVLEIASGLGISLTFDPNPRRKSWPDPENAPQTMLPFIRSASILKLGVGEPDTLGMTIGQIRSEQPTDSVLVLTDGSNGCWYWYGEAASEPVPSVAVESVDSTGAGDAFAAALTLRFVEAGRHIGRSDVEYTTVVGALTTTRQGAMDALPDASAVNDYLREI
ncbi:MAG: PfkB family carbohydrate kinase, partial [Thermomicrobiaceae bacterium]